MLSVGSSTKSSCKEWSHLCSLVLEEKERKQVPVAQGTFTYLRGKPGNFLGKWKGRIFRSPQKWP